MNAHARQEDGALVQVPIDKIRRDDAQARRDFDTVKLEELAASVKAVGILEPLELRPDPEHRFFALPISVRERQPAGRCDAGPAPAGRESGASGRQMVWAIAY